MVTAAIEKINKEDCAGDDDDDQSAMDDDTEDTINSFEDILKGENYMRIHDIVSKKVRVWKRFKFSLCKVSLISGDEDDFHHARPQRDRSLQSDLSSR